MTYRALLGGLLGLGLFLSPTLAHAEEGTTFMPPSSPPLQAPVAQPPLVVGEHTCFVGEHAGIDDADARTTADLVCGELGPLKAPPGIYDVRLGKLGARVLLGLTERASGVSRRLLVQSFDEVPVAARRLVVALLEHKSLAETQNVDNVVASESRKATSKSLDGTFELGLVGLSAIGVAPNASAGVAVGFSFRSGRVSMGSHFRGGGAGSGTNKLGLASIDIGARYHLSDADTAPFIGGGLSLSYMVVNRDAVTGPKKAPSNGYGYGYDSPPTADLSPEGSGFGAFVEGGVEVLRSSHAGVVLSLRADAPFYILKKEGSLGYPSSARSVTVERYVVPISVNLGFRFH